MTNAELNQFKKLLKIEQDELEQIVRNREAISIEKSADPLDEMQDAVERELAIRNLDRESNMLRNVRAALRRVDEGSFGACLSLRTRDQSETPRGCAVYPVLRSVSGTSGS